MSERKVLNKYYPPDFDPAKIPKLKLPKDRQYVVRLMAPFNMRCKTCGEYIYKGKKFNARKETVQNELYMGLPIFRFYIKCTRCLAEITFKTDPENTDYAMEHGATRNFQAEKLIEEEEKRVQQEREDEELNNPMKVLENRTKDSKMEMEVLENLQELKELNQRQALVDFEGMIDTYRELERREKEREKEEDERETKEMMDRVLVKRLRDSDSDSDEEKQKKISKTNDTNVKATDFLTSDKLAGPQGETSSGVKKLESWERSVGTLSGKASLGSLIIRKKPAAAGNKPSASKASTPPSKTDSEVSSDSLSAPKSTSTQNGRTRAASNAKSERGSMAKWLKLNFGSRRDPPQPPRPDYTESEILRAYRAQKDLDFEDPYSPDGEHQNGGLGSCTSTVSLPSFPAFGAVLPNGVEVKVVSPKHRLIKVDSQEFGRSKVPLSPVTVQEEIVVPSAPAPSDADTDYSDPFDARPDPRPKPSWEPKTAPPECGSYMEPFEAQRIISELQHSAMSSRSGSSDGGQLYDNPYEERGRSHPRAAPPSLHPAWLDAEGRESRLPQDDERPADEYDQPWEWKKDNISKALAVQFEGAERERSRTEHSRFVKASVSSESTTLRLAGDALPLLGERVDPFMPLERQV
uniref:Splicing factor YJU2 n=2 Tax=Knipowitschia caucasica TaxID=637954 RepID=A0AAV2JKJ4_KNICA